MNRSQQFCLLLCASTIFLSLPSRANAGPLIMADGWSTHTDGGEAAMAEAVSMMEETVENPHFIALYTTADYGEDKAVQYLRSRYPKAKLFGMNAFGSVFTSHGLHTGPSGSLAILGFSGGNLDCGVGIRPVPNGANISLITNDVLKEAAEDAGRTRDDVPSVILLGAPKGYEDKIVEAIAQSVPPTVPLLGGTPCDDKFRPGLAIGNDHAYEAGIVVALVYSNDKIGSSFCSGFVGKKRHGRITAGNGRVLERIDDRPALEVYREWTGGRFDDIDCSKDSVTIMSTALCPLAQAVELPGGDTHFVPVRPWRFNPDGSLSMGGDIAKGEDIYYVETTKRSLAKRPALVARDALVTARIKVDDIVGGLFIYCAGAAKTIGMHEDQGTARMVEDVARTMRGQPFIGGFTAGEQGNIDGRRLIHGNLMSSAVIFSD